jgi:hypothetical protein
MQEVKRPPWILHPESCIIPYNTISNERQRRIV